MSRNLDNNLKSALKRARRRTTLSMTLGDGTALHYSTAITNFGGIIYLPKLDPATESLNLETTGVIKGINLKISNKTLILGQSLINAPNFLNNVRARVGTYFYDPVTEDEWHDPKMPGLVKVGIIDGDWINIFVEGLASALFYDGITIESAFPNAEIPVPVQPVYNDLVNVPPEVIYGGGGGSSIDYYGGRYEKFYDRNYLPYMELPALDYSLLQY